MPQIGSQSRWGDQERVTARRSKARTGGEPAHAQALLDSSTACKVRKQPLNDIERIAAPGNEIVDAAKHHWTAQSCASQGKLFTRHPQRALDAAVECPCRIVVADRPAERESQEAPVSLRLLPEVDPDERLWMECPRGFFERFANGRLDDLFAALDVAGGLIEHHSVADALFDDEELSFALHDRRNG